jgi:hypothetical protein
MPRLTLSLTPKLILSLVLFLSAFLWSPKAYGQAATGIITGTVTDESGAVVPNAKISITNKATGATRSLAANAEGLYSAPALQAGDYEIRVEVEGFRTLVRDATVQAGTTTTVPIALTLGATREVVTVEAATAQVNYETHNVQGVIQRQNIQDLPLNGRNFLQLASLEPGVTATPGNAAQFNSFLTISTLGATTALYTVDGGNIDDERDGAGNLTSMNLSQEVIQEFQMSSVNFDLSTGITSGGAVNIVTRSGSNNFHGSAYFFYRDHNMAAYPALKRSALNPNPFFARRNPGFWVGGPIIKDKLFFFFNLEHMNQEQVYTVQEDLPSIIGLSTIAPSPYISNLITARFDYRLSDKHTLFARYSHDGNHSQGPASGAPELSGFGVSTNWSDQSIMGVTSALKPTLVNDFRFQFHYWFNSAFPEPASACQLPCVGGGFPNIASMIGSTTFSAGHLSNSPQSNFERSYEFKDEITWQRGTHRLKFGVDYELIDTYIPLYNWCDLGCLSLYSPETVTSLVSATALAASFPNLPTKVTTNADLLNLPVSNGTTASYTGIGIGNGKWPGGYEPNGHNHRPQLYATDTWKLRPNLTVNFGIRYTYESGLFDSSLPHPAFLAPILEGQTGGVPSGLGATQPNKLNFAPAFGFAWALGKDKKTVIRGGAGLYWDTTIIAQRFREDAIIGPLGDGRSTVGASILTNTIPGIFNFTTNQPLAIGAPLPITQLTNMSLGQFIQIYNQEIDGITQKLSPTPQKNGPYSVSGIDISKQGARILVDNYPLMRSYQTSIGFQRDLGHDMVLQADWARRQFENTNLGETDLNRFNRFINNVQTPVIPICTSAQLFIPGQECSTGAVTFYVPEGRSVYNGLLVKLQKRFAHRYQFVASYALAKNWVEAQAAAVNLNNYAQGFGENLARHNLNIAGFGDLPYGFKLSINNSIISRNPVEAVVPGIDINGSGVTNYPLPGLSYNCLAAGCGQSQLAAAVTSFNATYAGKKDARGATIPAVILPSNYEFGDPTFDTDVRLTKEFTFRERYKFSVLGEFFNAFNIANLTGYGFSLNSVNANPAKQAFTFGQPTQRFGQVFGSGGPRAIQVGGRFTF